VVAQFRDHWADGEVVRLRGAGATRREFLEHITGCRFPNRILVELPDFVPGENGVQIDLAALVAGIDLDDGKANDCSSGPAEASCNAPFAALGIDFDTGEQSGLQSVFSLR